jgi:hypothetical protein
VESWTWRGNFGFWIFDFGLRDGKEDEFAVIGYEEIASIAKWRAPERETRIARIDTNLDCLILGSYS